MSEHSVKQHVFRRGAAGGIPVSGTFELTARCNLNCRMCYIHMSEEEAQQYGRELTADEWIALGRDAVDAGMIYLLLTGGEPFLRPDFEEIYTALVQMGVMISINTNGTLVTPALVQCFKRHRPEQINVTLYGTSDASYGCLCGNPGAFSRAVHGIRMLHEAGLSVNLNTTITHLNLDDMEGLVAFAKEEHLPIRMSSYTFPPLRNHRTADPVHLTGEEMGRAAARFDRLTMTDEQLAGRRAYIRRCLEKETIAPADRPDSRISTCMAGRGAFWISWNGKMYPCGVLPMAECDVLESGFSDAWQRTRVGIRSVLLAEECLSCRYQPLCPNCAAVNTCENNIQQLCDRTRAYASALLDESE